MLAQLSENPGLDDFFNELMQPNGSEIYFRRMSQYIDITKKVKFGGWAFRGPLSVFCKW